MMLCGADLSMCTVLSKTVPVVKENIGIAFPPQYTSYPFFSGWSGIEASKTCHFGGSGVKPMKNLTCSRPVLDPIFHWL